MILHSDQDSVYTSKKYNDLLPMYNITHSLSRAGMPTDNAAMEAIKGWITAELFKDFHTDENKTTGENIESYIHFFNDERLAYALRSLMPRQYREAYANLEMMD